MYTYIQITDILKMFGILPPPYQPPAPDREMLISSLLREASLCSESRAPWLLGAENTWRLSTQPQIGYQSICLKLRGELGRGGKHRGWRQCESRKKGGRATNYCFPGMTKPLETPAHSSCEWMPGANRRVGLSIGSHWFYRGTCSYLSLLHN